MKSQPGSIASLRSTRGCALAAGRGERSPRTRRRTRIEAINVSLAERRQGRRQGDAEGGAGQSARRVHHQQSAAHRVRLPQHRQRARAAAPRTSREGDLRSINVVQAGDRTRLVLNLRARRRLRHPDRRQVAADHPAGRRRRRGARRRDHRISPKPRAGDAAPRRARHRFPPRRRRRRPHRGRPVRQRHRHRSQASQGRTIVVDFINTALPKNLERRLDVIDFGTPVQTVDAFPQGDNARIVIEPRGNWEHTAYQTDNRFIVEVKQLVEDPNRLRAAAATPARSCRSTSRTWKCARCCR